MRSVATEGHRPGMTTSERGKQLLSRSPTKSVAFAFAFAVEDHVPRWQPLYPAQ
jgi:hypothetical protein